MMPCIASCLTLPQHGTHDGAWHPPLPPGTDFSPRNTPLHAAYSASSDISHTKVKSTLHIDDAIQTQNNSSKLLNMNKSNQFSNKLRPLNINTKVQEDTASNLLIEPLEGKALPSITLQPKPNAAPSGASNIPKYSKQVKLNQTFSNVTNDNLNVEYINIYNSISVILSSLHSILSLVLYNRNNRFHRLNHISKRSLFDNLDKSHIFNHKEPNNVFSRFNRIEPSSSLISENVREHSTNSRRHNSIIHGSNIRYNQPNEPYLNAQAGVVVNIKSNYGLIDRSKLLSDQKFSQDLFSNLRESSNRKSLFNPVVAAAESKRRRERLSITETPIGTDKLNSPGLGFSNNLLSQREKSKPIADKFKRNHSLLDTLHQFVLQSKRLASNQKKQSKYQPSTLFHYQHKSGSQSQHQQELNTAANKVLSLNIRRQFQLPPSSMCDAGNKNSHECLRRFNSHNPEGAGKSQGKRNNIIPVTSAVQESQVTEDSEVTPGLFQGDIALSADQSRLRLGLRWEVRPERKWQNGIVPYAISPEYFPNERQLIMSAIATVNFLSCVQFVPWDGKAPDYIFIRQAETPRGCWSYVGREGGRQIMSLQRPDVKSKRCFVSIGKPIHELLHVLGVLHEHTREDRDQYIEVIEKNIQDEFFINFEKLSLANTTYEYPYDYDSVMHYGRLFFSKDGVSETIKPLSESVKIGQRSMLSVNDCLKLNSLYGCLDPSHPKSQMYKVFCNQLAL